jgi:general secretion pathway protein A
MYLEYFKLTEQPFSITPDPRFLYMSARHREALAHLLYGLGESGGFVQLTGEVGTGKTTICRCLLEQVPENVDVAVVLNPKVTAQELLATICDELGIANPGDNASIKSLIDILNRYLLDAHARGRRTVLIIDEAQNLSADVLEQVRLLTNLETSTEKLLQIILIGQPELRDLLARADMRQLSQRITARYHLEPISREEADAYIRHRLQVCGSSQNLFSKRAVDKIHKLSDGIPRLINVLCDRALLGTYVEGRGIVDHKVVSKASREVLADSDNEKTVRRWPPLVAGALVVALLAGSAAYYQPWKRLMEPVAVSADKQPMSTDQAVPSVAPVEAIVAAVEAVDVDSGEAANAEPTPVSLGERLEEADSSWYRTAWQALFSRWQVVLPDAVKPDFCNYAREYGLLCIVGQGDWNTLRELDRPAVLTLTREDSVRVPVFLQSMQGSTLEMDIGGELYRLETGQVGNYWFGDYAVFVQAPPGGTMYLKVGDRDVDVAWLREQFEIAQGVRIPAADAMLFDYPLQKHVLAFQRARGLLADGIVGKNTLIHLNTAIDRQDVPRLVAE